MPQTGSRSWLGAGLGWAAWESEGSGLVVMNFLLFIRVKCAGVQAPLGPPRATTVIDRGQGEC